jgi:hypothetical protein
MELQISGARPMLTTLPANHVNLVVATPCFGGQISIAYAASLLKLERLVRRYGGFNLKVLFIDADIGFEPQQVVRLIECGAEMCAAVYPVKLIDWDKVRKTVEAARPNPSAAALKYVFEVDDPNAVTEKGGFVKVRYAGNGFLMIRRAALERLCAHYPALRYKRDHSLDAATASDNRFALFECMIGEDGTYLSEDFAFCKRWTDMGGEIWADLDSKLNHVGPMAFRGDLASQFVSANA